MQTEPFAINNLTYTKKLRFLEPPVQLSIINSDVLARTVGKQTKCYGQQVRIFFGEIARCLHASARADCACRLLGL